MLRIFFEDKIFTSDIKHDTSVKMIKDNFFAILGNEKIGKFNLSVFNSDFQLLNGNDKIEVKSNNTTDIYIIMNPIFESNKDNTFNLANTIKDATQAKEILKFPQNLSILNGEINSDYRINRFIEMINNFSERPRHTQEVVEPNEEYVTQLIDMGFEEDKARNALVRSRNNLNRATDILLSSE